MTARSIRRHQRVRSTLGQLIQSRSELDARLEIATALAHGGTPVSEIPDRSVGTVCGVVRSVILRPPGEVLALEVEIYDGSGTLRVVWLGRRRIPGIEPGRRITVTGLVAVTDGRPTMFNPEYELLPGAA